MKIRPTLWKLVFLFLMAAGLYATVIRFTRGLGPSTNLSDQFPWGIWIGFDVLCGVMLAAGGFTLTAAVHILNIKRLKPIVPLLRLAAGSIRLLNRFGIYRRHLEQLDLRSLDRQFPERLARPDGAEALERRYASVLHDLRIMPAANFFQDLIEVVRPLPIRQLRTPFLALLSTGRTFSDPDATRSLLARLPRGDIRTLESKHWIPTEQPVAMRHAIEAWCQALTT